MYPFEGDESFVRNAWYVVAWSDEISREILARTVLDEPLVMYRTEAGGVVVLEGTCAHKVYPLHLGQLQGDRLQCTYHGYVYGTDGRCVHIPTQEALPARCAIRAYPAVERWQWVWAWMGDPALADEVLIPDHDAVGLTAPGWRADQGMTMEIDARYMLINDNLIDLTHLGFLHPKFAGPLAEGMGRTRSTVFTDPSGRFQTDTRVIPMGGPEHCPPMPGAEQCEQIDLELSIDFYPPGFHVGRSRYFERRADGSCGPTLGHARFVHGITPRTAHSCFYFFGQARDFALDDDEYGRRALEKNMAVIPEDKTAAENLEPFVDRPGRRPDFVAAADVGVIRARRWMQALIDAERDPEPGQPAALARHLAPN